jgi:hypothetical protein
MLKYLLILLYKNFLNLISNITGETGLRIINAILAGERNPLVLAKLRGKQIQKGEEEIAKALAGNYREEHLFTLQQEYDLYMTYQNKIAQCDEKILEHCKTLQSKIEIQEEERKGATKKRIKFNLTLICIFPLKLSKLNNIQCPS